MKNKRPTVTTTLKNLVALYRKQGRNEAADQLDNCAVKIKKDPTAITQAIEVVQRVQMSDTTNRMSTLLLNNSEVFEKKKFIKFSIFLA